jgi:hypothetical protein
VAAERLADFMSVAGQDVDHAPREAGFDDQLIGEGRGYEERECIVKENR